MQNECYKYYFNIGYLDCDKNIENPGKTKYDRDMWQKGREEGLKRKAA